MRGGHPCQEQEMRRCRAVRLRETGSREETGKWKAGSTQHKNLPSTKLCVSHFRIWGSPGTMYKDGLLAHWALLTVAPEED